MGRPTPPYPAIRRDQCAFPQLGAKRCSDAFVSGLSSSSRRARPRLRAPPAVAIRRRRDRAAEDEGEDAAATEPRHRWSRPKSSRKAFPWILRRSATLKPTPASRCAPRSPESSNNCRSTRATWSSRDSCCSRSIADRSKPPLPRRRRTWCATSALLAQSEAQMARDASQRGVSAARRRASTAAEPARHHLEGRRRADAFAGGRDRRGRQGRSRGDRQRAGAAPGAAKRCGCRAKCRSTTPSSNRRSTDRPATSA